SASSGTLRPAENATGSSASDQTALSGLADRIRLAISQANSLSSFRPELVAQLKTAIANQTYSPEPDLVAARVAAAIGRQ
ncbi:MAG TPA: flagellar biosynthesis anti-sigma factor FlgM, partial [Candidatus Binataceae bacterium]|nr:flagellar biosynthesis anti-sigma factor FlgM [Candidatus Binataceae bacterium]